MQPHLKQLGLTQLEQALPMLFETARQEQWTYEQFLKQAVAAEVEGRDRRAVERRMVVAHLPVVKTLEAFDFAFQPSLSERLLWELADLSFYSVATYVTQTREWLSELPLTESNSVLTEAGVRQHVALVYFNFEASHWAELTMRSRGKVEQRNQNLLSLHDASGVIARGRELLVHQDWAALAAGILLMVGRRVGEVLVSGEITPKSDYSVMFSGRLKLRGRPDYAFEIPTLCEAALVLDAWQRLRSHPDLLVLSLPTSEPTRRNLDVVNGKLYPKVRQAVTHFFAPLVPGVGEGIEEEKLFSHLLRSLYATLAVWRYCPVRVDPDTFRAKILGHHYYFRAQGQERLNYMSGHFYHRFVILTPDGSLDGRRGIALGEPGVRVLEAFPEVQEMQQTESLGAAGAKTTKRKRKERNSKTGYTLIKPRNESGKRFDEIARATGLDWKGEDATFVLLLDTYDAHAQEKRAESNPINPVTLTPEQLGLSESLVAEVKEAMQLTNQASFWDFLQDALARESHTQIGLAKTRQKREKERPDFSGVPTSDLLKTRRLPEAYERIRRAIATIIEHNRATDNANDRWFITQTLLREFTGAHPRFIRPVLDANAELIERHHQHFGIVSAHNRTPAPKPLPIAKSLRIAETTAELPCLEEIALPSLDAEVQAEPSTASCRLSKLMSLVPA